MMPINAAFITADGEFVPSNLFKKKPAKICVG